MLLVRVMLVSGDPEVLAAVQSNLNNLTLHHLYKNVSLVVSEMVIITAIYLHINPLIYTF